MHAAGSLRPRTLKPMLGDENRAPSSPRDSWTTRPFNGIPTSGVFIIFTPALPVRPVLWPTLDVMIALFKSSAFLLTVGYCIGRKSFSVIWSSGPSQLTPTACRWGDFQFPLCLNVRELLNWSPWIFFTWGSIKKWQKTFPKSAVSHTHNDQRAHIITFTSSTSGYEYLTSVEDFL